VLVLAPTGGGGDSLVDELRSRKDLRIVRASGLEQAGRIVERQAPAVAVAAPDVPTEWVDAVVAAIERRRPGTPVLALREAGAEQPASWDGHSVGVLRCPLVALTLSRSIDVVLRLTGARDGAP
jgi:hypothetical protein